MSTITYKCTVCKRQVEKLENPYGIDVFAKCIITSGCKGKLHKIGRNLDNIRESFPKFEVNLEDYTPRNVFNQHVQSIAADMWTVRHGLESIPSITVYVKDSAGTYQPLNESAYTSKPLDRNTIVLTFPSATSGIAQAVARSSTNNTSTKVSISSSNTQVTVGGTFVFAVPKIVTKSGSGGTMEIDLKNPTNPVRIEVSIERPNDEPIMCYEKISGMLDITPWTGVDEVLVSKRRNYYLKTKNILNFSTFNNPDLKFSDIPEGTRIRFLNVDFGTGISVPIESKSILLLLSAAPYSFSDKVRNKIVDIGEICGNGGYFTYVNGEFAVDTDLVESTYPPIQAARKVGAIPPSPTPTPTPT